MAQKTTLKPSMKLVLITGSKEACKDGIVELALGRLKSRCKFRSLDFEKLSIKQGRTLDDLKAFPAKLQERLEKELVSELKGKKNHMILNGRLTLSTPYGLFPALSNEFFSVFKPDAIVVLEPSPGDLVRNPKISLETLQHQEVERSYAAMYASISGSPLRVIIVEKNNIALAVSQLVKYLKTLLQG